MKRILRYLSRHKGAVACIAVFLIIQAACEISLPGYTADIVDRGIQEKDLAFLGGACVKMLLLSALMLLASAGASFTAARTGAAIGRDLRSRIFKKVVSFSGPELDHFSTASLITRCTNDVQQVTTMCTMLLRMVLYAPIIGAAGIIMVMTTSTGMSWIIVLAVIAIVALVLGLMRLAHPKFQAMQGLMDDLNLISREILTGINVVRAFNRQGEEERRFEDSNVQLMKTQIFANRVMNFMMPSMMLIMNGISVLVVLVGSRSVDAGTIQVGDMIAFITYAMLIVMAFMMITMISIFLPRAGVAAGRIDEVLETECSIKDPEASEEGSDDPVRGEIRFDHVSFKYPGAEENVLTDISFTAEAGKTTAIIGSTGSGKSTIMQLILRFYDVTSGSILLDGKDIRSISSRELRRHMGYIPQKATLFSGTVESNVKYSGSQVSDDIMNQAVEAAQAEEFVKASPEGFKQRVSQDGSNLSGGQRQRLAIARAIAAQPEILLFDDSFSALDFKTDAALRKALSQITGGAAKIIVAQRISTIMNADCIVVLEEGRVVGTGRHSQLMENCPVYRETALSQMTEERATGGEA